MRCRICGTLDLYSSRESLLMMAVSTPLRYRRSLTFSVGPRVTIGRTCTAPPSFTTRAISVAKRMGAPSRRPPARPIVPALSRSRICASPEMADEVRRDCAILLPRSVLIFIEWNYDDLFDQTYNRIDGDACTLRFKYRAIPSNFICHLGRGADTGSAQCRDDRSGRGSSGGCTHPFRDGNRARRE